MIPKIMLIGMSERHNTAARVQEILTKHGCIIKVRLGLHETEKLCSPCGLIILQLADEPSEIKNLENDLKAIKEIDVKVVQMECGSDLS